MKKGLLLSIVASTVIFAGGDIAPVEPAAAAPAADCSEFYGQVGAYYRGYSADAGDLFATDVTDTAGMKIDPDTELPKKVQKNQFSVTATIGVEKELANGIGFGAEVAGWSSLGFYESTDLTPIISRAPSNEGGELSQLFLTASFNNTSIKVGRFAIPASLSPLAYTDTTAGVKDVTFEGVVVANTDLADTTIYGAAILKQFDVDTRSEIGDDSLLIAGGFVNTSLANTTIKGVGYYIPEMDTTLADSALYAGYLSVDTKLQGYNFSAQAAVIAGDDDVMGAGNNDATFEIGARIGGTLGMFNVSLAGTYINDGDFPSKIVGGFWMYTSNEIDAVLESGYATTAILANASTAVGIGTLYASYGYWDADSDDSVVKDRIADYATGVRVGYRFNLSGVAVNANYRLLTTTDLAGTEFEQHQVRLEATYKF